MTALDANRPIPNIIAAQPYAGGGYVLDVLVGALEEIYQGSFVTLDTGDQYLASLAAGEAMYGLSLDRVTGGASNGDVTCRVFCGGIIQHTLSSVAVADIGKPVFATDDQTITLTNDGTDTPVGMLVGVPVTGTAIVRIFDPRIELTAFANTTFVVDYDIDNENAVTFVADQLATLIRELFNQGIIKGTVTA